MSDGGLVEAEDQDDGAGVSVDVRHVCCWYGPINCGDLWSSV